MLVRSLLRSLRSLRSSFVAVGMFSFVRPPSAVRRRKVCLFVCWLVCLFVGSLVHRFVVVVVGMLRLVGWLARFPVYLLVGRAVCLLSLCAGMPRACCVELVVVRCVLVRLVSVRVPLLASVLD